jgi:hypothetical protein
MEVQMTDFENAAFSVLVVLLSRAILFFNLNFYVPISKVSVYTFPTSPIDVVFGRSMRICKGPNGVMLQQPNHFSSEKMSTPQTQVLLLVLLRPLVLAAQ